VCNDFTPTFLNALGIHNLVTGEKGAANGALEKMAIGRLLVSASTPQKRDTPTRHESNGCTLRNGYLFYD